MKALNPLQRKLVDWAGARQLNRLSASELQLASKALGVSPAAVRDAVEMLLSTGFGSRQPDTNQLAGACAAPAPHVARSVGYEVSPRYDLDIMIYNRSAIDITLREVEKRGRPVVALFGDIAIKVEARPGDTAADLEARVEAKRAARRQQLDA